MKYTIEGFSQEYACTLKKEVEEKGKPKIIKIDCTDLAILRWFTDFYPAMQKAIVDGKEYAFLSHQYLADEMPILDISKKGYIARMQKLVEFGILDYKLIKKDGNIPMYTFGANYVHLVSNKGVGGSTNQPLDGQPANPYPVNPPTLGRSTGQPLDGQPDNKNTSIINPSIKDSSTKHPHQEYVDRYHSICTNLPRVVALNDQRKEAVRKFAEQFTFDQFDEICRRANVSAFLTGKTSKPGWKADFEFLLRPKQAIRILEGGYDDAQKPTIYDPDSEGLKY